MTCAFILLCKSVSIAPGNLVEHKSQLKEESIRNCLDKGIVRLMCYFACVPSLNTHTHTHKYSLYSTDKETGVKERTQEDRRGSRSAQ